MLEKVFTSIFVTIANVKGCIHGCQEDLFMGGQGGGIWVFLLETKTTTILLKFSKSRRDQAPLPPFPPPMAAVF